MPGRTAPIKFGGRTSPLPWAGRTSPLDFSRLARAFPQYICLIEIDFDTGTEYFSFEGVGVPAKWYEPLVKSIGEISREAPLFGDQYHVSDVQITLINDSQYFTKKKASAKFYGRVVRILYGDAQDGAARMVTVFTGHLYKWTATESGEFTIQVRDFSFDRFRQYIHLNARVLTTDVFPSLPVGAEPRLVPIVYGNCNVDPAADLTTYDLGGPVPCYLIDINASGKWRYVVAEHVCKSVDDVFIYGVKTAAANYTVTQVTYDSVSMTVIDFNSDPRNSTRSSELEITAAVKGITDDGLTTGTLLSDPVDVINHYLLNYTGTVAADIDSSLKSVANSVTTAAGYACAFTITDRNIFSTEILAKWAQSFLGSIFVTRESKIGIFVKTTAAPPTPTVFFTADIEMLDDSFSVESNQEVVNHIQYNWFYHPVRDFFAQQPLLEVSGSEVPNNEVCIQYNLWFVRDSTTALAVANSIVDLSREAVEYPKFDLTPDQFLVVDLNAFVGISHWQGIAASGGYNKVTVRIYAVGLQLLPTDMKIRVESLKLSA